MRKFVAVAASFAIIALVAPIRPASAVGSCELAFNDATAACTAGSTFNSCYDAAAREYLECLEREATVNQ